MRPNANGSRHSIGRCNYYSQQLRRQGALMLMQARAREDVVIRIKEVWNLHDTILELIDRLRGWIAAKEGDTDSETRGLVNLMNGKLLRLRRLAAEWQQRFGHLVRDDVFNYDAVIDALDANDQAEEPTEEEGQGDEDEDQ